MCIVGVSMPICQHQPPPPLAPVDRIPAPVREYVEQTIFHTITPTYILKNECGKHAAQTVRGCCMTHAHRRISGHNPSTHLAKSEIVRVLARVIELQGLASLVATANGRDLEKNIVMALYRYGLG